MHRVLVVDRDEDLHERRPVGGKKVLGVDVGTADRRIPEAVRRIGDLEPGREVTRELAAFALFGRSVERVDAAVEEASVRRIDGPFNRLQVVDVLDEFEMRDLVARQRRDTSRSRNRSVAAEQPHPHRRPVALGHF